MNADLIEWLKTEDTSLTETLGEELRQHIKLLNEQGGFYGYAVLSLAGDLFPVQYLRASYNREEDIDPELNNFYYRSSPNEWKSYGLEVFPKSSEILQSKNAEFAKLHHKDSADYFYDEYQITHVKRLHRAMLSAMKLVQNDGLFDEKFSVLWAPDSPDDILFCSVKALNSAETFEDFLQEFGDEDQEFDCDSYD